MGKLWFRTISARRHNLSAYLCPCGNGIMLTRLEDCCAGEHAETDYVASSKGCGSWHLAPRDLTVMLTFILRMIRKRQSRTGAVDAERTSVWGIVVATGTVSPFMRATSRSTAVIPI